MIGALITAVTFPFLVRRLGVEMYGLWSYVIAVAAFLENIANPGLAAFAAQQVASKRSEASEIVSDVLVLRGVLWFAAASGVLAVSFFEVRPDVARLLRFFGIANMFVNLASADTFLLTMERFHERALLAVIQQALYAIGILTLVRSPQDVIWVPFSIVVSALITNLAGWIVLYRAGLRPHLGIHPRRWWPILVPSAHYALASLMSSVYHRAGHIIVRWVLGEHVLGVYAAATRLVDFIKNLLGIVQSVIVPRIARVANSAEALRRISRFAVTLLALFAVPSAIGLFGAANVIVPLVLGKQFLESVALLPWLSGYVVSAPAASLFCGTILYALGKHREYLMSTVFGGVAGLILYATLTPWIGVKGACLAFVLAEVVVAAAAYWYAPLEVKDVWNNPLLGIILAAALVMLLTLVGALRYSTPLVATAAATVMYALTCLTLARKRILQEWAQTR